MKGYGNSFRSCIDKKKILLYKNNLLCTNVYSKHKMIQHELKFEADKLDVDNLAELDADKLEPAPTDLSKLVL